MDIHHGHPSTPPAAGSSAPPRGFVPPQGAQNLRVGHGSQPGSRVRVRFTLVGSLDFRVCEVFFSLKHRSNVYTTRALYIRRVRFIYDACALYTTRRSEKEIGGGARREKQTSE